MKVILNSDLIYATYLIKDKLPGSLQDLCGACIEQNVPIVVPETALLEFNNKQLEHADRERTELGSAYDRLDRYGIQYDHSDPDDLIFAPDLLKLLKDTGVTVELVIPVEDELRQAHRRACLHQPPLSKDSKGNEMRDLVIWLIALRVAREDGEAVLMSADRVHNAEVGKAEAKTARLNVADNIESGMELLELKSPSTEFARKLMEPAWALLENAGLGAEMPIVIRSVRDSRFVQGAGVIGEASFSMKAITEDGRELVATVELHTDNGHQRVALSSVQFDGQPQPDVAIDFAASLNLEDYRNRLSSLKDIVGE